MTDRAKGLIVSLENDIRDDDVETIVNAINMIKGVDGVTLNIVDSDDWLNRKRIKNEFSQKLYAALNDVLKD